jgi:hypothetical protein
MKVNIFELARLQLAREKKDLTTKNLLEKAIYIRKWFDKHEKHVDAIMRGAVIYQYGNVLKTYANAL